MGTIVTFPKTTTSLTTSVLIDPNLSYIAKGLYAECAAHGTRLADVNGNAEVMAAAAELVAAGVEQ